MIKWSKKEYDPSIHCSIHGKRLSIGLFFETCADSDTKPLYSLKEWGKVYVDIADPTGYTQCIHLLGDWEHWNVLRNNPTLKSYFDSWSKEVEVKLRSEAIKSMIASSKGDKGQSSAKWLAEAGFIPQEEKRDGRKKKDKGDEEDIKKEVSARIKGDMERLGLKVVGGSDE